MHGPYSWHWHLVPDTRWVILSYFPLLPSLTFQSRPYYVAELNYLYTSISSFADGVICKQCPQHCGWDQTNAQGLPSPVEEKGQHGHSLKGRAPRPLPWQAFIAFLGTSHWGWSSFTMHRFALGGYLLQKTKERMLLITSKRKDICKSKGKSGWSGYTPPWKL